MDRDILRDERDKQEKTMRPRVQWIDQYKGIAILLVIIHHVTQYFPSLSFVWNYICDFHVSMFFFIAGATIGLPGNRRKSLKDYIVSRVKRLLVPYFCFSVISAAIKFIVLFIQKAFTSTIILKEIQEILTIGNGPVWLRTGPQATFYWLCQSSI